MPPYQERASMWILITFRRLVATQKLLFLDFVTCGIFGWIFFSAPLIIFATGLTITAIAAWRLLRSFRWEV